MTVHWVYVVGMVIAFFVGYALSHYQDSLRVKLWLETEESIRKESKRLGIRARVKSTDTLEQLRARLLDLQSRVTALDLEKYKQEHPTTYPPEAEGEEIDS
jgi:hypothetical protein